tara:strand:+ start:31467 stop:36008 length:4542 start_codon:yes stop_codon:yes gene_type:complete
MNNQKPHITSYEKGMNKDINVESLPQNTYVDAQNFRLFTTGDGASVGGIQNIKGTRLEHTFTNFNERVIGSTQLRDALIVFTAVSIDEPSTGRIYKLEFDFETEEVSVELLYESDDLQFTAAAPIEAIAVHETNFIQRIYFSDFVRPTRSMNIADPLLQDLPVSSFSIFPSPPIKKPQIDFIFDGGQLPVGVYNYTYYLVTAGGQKTLLAPVSNQVHIIVDSEEVGSTSDYQGTFTEPGDTIFTTKSVSITVDTSALETNQFEKIVFVGIFLEEIGGTPSIFEFEETLITGTTQEAVHSGTEDQLTITLADFLSETYSFITNKTFSIKDDTLFVGNVKTGGFTLSDEDAEGLQTKRYDSQQTTYDDPYANPFNDESGLDFGGNPDGSYDFWLNNYQYMFQPDGTTIGGFANYLSYKFTLEEMLGFEQSVGPNTSSIDSEQQFSLNDEYTEVNRNFRNFASPYKRTLRGYKRGEVYRFGIVFYDKLTGLQSPAYYVGDIKFPEMSQPFGTELPGGYPITNPFTGLPTGVNFDHYAVSKRVTTEGAEGTSRLYSLGLEFSFNFPNSILNNIRGFQIVRVPRTPNDRTRLSQGVISKYYNIDVQVLEQQAGWSEGSWTERDSKNQTFCPISELPSVYGHLNRIRVHGENEGDTFNAEIGEKADIGFNFLGGDTPGIYGYHNGLGADSEGAERVDYQSLFSTTGLLNFFNPETSYDYGLPGMRRGIDFLKTVGVYGDGFKRTNKSSQYEQGAVGVTKELGHTFQQDYINNPELLGNNRFRPRISPNSTIGANFFRFPATASGRDNREFQTKALSTNRLGQFGTQTAAEDISNPTAAAFNLEKAYEKIEGYRILTTTSPYRDSVQSVGGMDVVKKCFHSGNPFAYFAKETRLAKEGKSAVISLMEDHTNPDQYFTKGRFVGLEEEFDVANTPENIDNHDSTLGYASSHIGKGTTFMVEHVRRVGEQYGGNGADAVFTNTFITCSDPVEIDVDNPIQPSSIRVFQGDTFVALYQFAKNFWNNYYTNSTAWNQQSPPSGQTLPQAYNGSNSSSFESVTIPVETVVNIELGSGTRFEEGAQFNDQAYRVQEYPDYQGIGNDTSGGRSKFFHQYDGVFSEETVSKRFFSLPPGQTEAETHFDVRTHYSATKTLGEERDSFSDFAIADYKDLDPQYGPINRIMNFKDTLFAFQDNAVGGYLINTRELLTGEQGAALSIGTGQGISDYQYISTEYGCIHQYAVTKTDSGVYFLDARRQKFFLLGENLTDLSEVLGMNDFLRSRIPDSFLITRENGGDNPLLYTGPHMTYDPLNKEIWLTSGRIVRPEVPGNGPGDPPLSEQVIGGFTLCFSETLKAFSSFYSQLPNIYLQSKRRIISPSPSDPKKLYLHDVGDYGVFYDTDPEESSITIRVNSLGVANKILRFLEYNSIVKDFTLQTEPIVQDQGLSSIKIENDYQESGKESLDGRQKRRFRKWRVKLPRDNKSQNALGRFRGTYFDITLYFDNSVNLSIMLERIMSYYDVHMY